MYSLRFTLTTCSKVGVNRTLFGKFLLRHGHVALTIYRDQSWLKCYMGYSYELPALCKKICKILTYSIYETGQEIILCKEKKIDGEAYEVFTRAPVMDYWEMIAREKIESMQRSALLEERVARLSEKVRGKRRAEDQLEPSTAAESSRLNEVFDKVSEVPFTVLVNRLIKNNCLDLSNESEGSVLFYLPTEQAEVLKKIYASNPKLMQLDHRVVKLIRNLLMKKNQTGEAKIAKKFLELSSQYPDNAHIFMIFYRVVDIRISVSEFFDSNEIINCSEQDFVIKAWGPILFEVFRHSKLTLRWGDTIMENTTAPFKVDLRVICTINGEKYDVGFAEFAKNFTAPKAQRDRVKLILEAKEALNVVFKVIGEFMPDIKFYTLQIAGLKGNLISTALQDDGLYTAQNVSNRVRFPIASNDIYDETSHLIKVACKFKNQCLKTNDILEKALTMKNQKRLSFETVLDKAAKKKYRSQPLPLSVLAVHSPCTPLWLEKEYKDE